MPAILHFLSQNVEVPSMLRHNLVLQWIKKVAAKFGSRVGELNYIFCDDSRILEINRQFINHDYYTDIITFDYTRPGIISGDIYISIDTIYSNSRLFRTTFERELYRVVIHGVLHLLGINDKGPGEREIMERYENESLALLDSLIADNQ